MDKVYIVFANNDKIYEGEYGECNPTIEYLSLSKEKVEEYLEKERYKYFTTPGNVIEEDKPDEFSCSIYPWFYHYWIEEYDLDKEII